MGEIIKHWIVLSILQPVNPWKCVACSFAIIPTKENIYSVLPDNARASSINTWYTWCNAMSPHVMTDRDLTDTDSNKKEKMGVFFKAI